MLRYRGGIWYDEGTELQSEVLCEVKEMVVDWLLMFGIRRC